MLLLDISMPVMNRIEAAEQLMRLQTETKAVFLTIHDGPDFVKAALTAGALGYVVKSHMATDLLIAELETVAGHHHISPCLNMKSSSKA